MTLPAPIFVTLLYRRDCSSSRSLVERVSAFRDMSHIRLRLVEVDRDILPPFAQGFVVPATYIGARLWRYGSYSCEELAARVQWELKTREMDT
jgi:hypothetical protein